MLLLVNIVTCAVLLGSKKYISIHIHFFCPSVSLSLYLLARLQRFDCRWRRRSQTSQCWSLSLSDWAVAFLPSRPGTPASPCPGTWSAPKTRRRRNSRAKKRESGSVCSPLDMMPFSEMGIAAPERMQGQTRACSLRG